jgi:hypothetical protein
VGWRAFSAAGIHYDLSHLDPFLLVVTPKAGSVDYRALVTFGHHTFTRELRPSDDAALRYESGSDFRCFCPERHGHSMHLPRIINASANARAYFSHGRNYLLIEDMPGLRGPYAVFFNLAKARGTDFDVNLFVVSAYPKPNLPMRKRLEAITMPTLIGKTVRGEPITRPPPRAKK